LTVSNDGNESSEVEKKSTHQRRGGKGMAKPKKEKPPSKIIVSKQQRKGNKYVTIIAGLSSNDVDIEVAKKFFAQKFSCGCSKGENDELIIQGDVLDNLFSVIPERFPQVRLQQDFLRVFYEN
jgi:density-regulated protein DRP1